MKNDRSTSRRPQLLLDLVTLDRTSGETLYRQLYLRLVELIVDSGLLPEGTLQFVAGSVGDMFDHLTEQDLVAFTGSASTAAKLRTHPGIVGRSVLFLRTRHAEALEILNS